MVALVVALIPLLSVVNESTNSQIIANKNGLLQDYKILRGEISKER